MAINIVTVLLFLAEYVLKKDYKLTAVFELLSVLKYMLSHAFFFRSLMGQSRGFFFNLKAPSNKVFFLLSSKS